MKMRIILLISVLVASVILIVAADDNDENNKDRPEFKLPKLFSFGYYKELFRKHYGSISEELFRRGLFLAKAYRAFISGVSYKFRLSNHYLAVNDFSDQTPAEIRSMNSKLVLDDNLNRVHLHGHSESMQAESLQAMSVENLEQKLNEIKSKSDEPGYSIIAGEVETLDGRKQRRKRDTESRIRNDFTMDQLIEYDNSRWEENPEIKAKILRAPISNNPDYEPPEVISQGMGDYLPSLSVVTDSISNFVYNKNFDDNSAAILARGLSKDAKVEKVEKLPDEVFVDHRNCLLSPKKQGGCGSCYAFTATSYFEWAICNETGKLVPLSEQYMIDCGPNLPNEDIAGCEGGFIYDLGVFFEEYGFELASNYPYIGRNGTCPYTDPKSAGFFRGTELEKKFIMPVELFARHLKHAPILVPLGVADDFSDYGGGVHHGKKCLADYDTEGGHAMLLVGHGRQDGEEYWLLRNSYGPRWGEKGYYKINKKADCFKPRYGFMFGTKDGVNVQVFLKKNNERPEGIDESIQDIKRYYKHRIIGKVFGLFGHGR